VRAQEHFLTVVMTGFGRFGECSGYAVDTGTPIDFSHFAAGYVLPPASVEGLRVNKLRKMHFSIK
jgi:hypothetical protein